MTDYRLLDFVETPIFALELGPNGLPCYAALNSFARDVLEVPLEEVLGKTACDLYPGRLGRVAYDHHIAAFEDGKVHEYEIKLPIGGAVRQIHTHLQPKFNDQGDLIAVIGTSIDMSNEQIIREMDTSVDAITSEMEEFVHLAAHDLRSPMRHVQMVAEMLREDFVDMGDGKLDLIDSLEKVGTLAMSLIGDVLSHAQAVNTDHRNGIFDIAELAQAAMGLLDPMEDHSLHCKSTKIYGDTTAMQIILRNLIDNSLKAARLDPDLDGNLQIEIDVADLDGVYMQVMLRDTGPGFGDPSRAFYGETLRTTGSGFGLIGVKRLVHARGGTIRAANRTDRSGAKVTFTLPGYLYGDDGYHDAQDDDLETLRQHG